MNAISNEFVNLSDERIHLRVTDEEKQSLVEKAAMARQSVSQYILSLSENKTNINRGKFSC